jgi:ribosome recycling factor
VVKPWDQSLVGKISKGIAVSDLHLNPVVDGDIIRISIPPLTEERRRDLVKLVKQKLESGRNMLRQARHDVKSMIDKREGEANVSEDDIRQAIEDLDKLIDEYNGKIEEIGEAKEKELMTV